MVRVMLFGRITNVKLGASASSTVDIAANTKFVRWRDRPDRVQPVTVAATVIPVGWNQGHKWSFMDIGVLSEAKDAFYDQAAAYIDDDGDNVVIPYLVITFTNSVAGTETVTTASAIVDYVEYNVTDFEDSVNVYHLKAYYIGPPT